MAACRKSTDSLLSVPDNICVSYLPDSDKISKTVMDRRLNKYMSSFLDDVKIFEPNEGEQTMQVSARCFRSMRKNAEPHRVSFELNTSTQRITESYCTCKAGVNGHCSHIVGLIKTLQYFKLNNYTRVPEKLCCISLPQAWGAPAARGVKIDPVPINHLTLARPVENRKRRPLSCAVDVEKKVLKVTASEITSLRALNGTPLEYMLTPAAPLTTTVLGEVQVGSALSYQARNLKKAPVEVTMQQCGNTSVNNQAPVNLPEQFKCLLDKLKCVDPEDLEQNTRQQSESRDWVQARKERLTASNFHRVLKRKAKVTDKFLESIFSVKSFSAPALDYGKRHESSAKSKYLETFPDRHLHECGLVVNNKFPFLGATPDAKVCDGGHTGILEVKCPYASRNNTITEACQLPDFCLQQTDQSVCLKKTHSYYTQVQGQLMVTGCNFCDFVVFTQQDIHVERVFPDIPFMTSMLSILAAFYRDHVAPYLQERADHTC